MRWCVAARAASPPHVFPFVAARAASPLHVFPSPLHVQDPRRTGLRSSPVVHHVRRTRSRATTSPHVQDPHHTSTTPAARVPVPAARAASSLHVFPFAARGAPHAANPNQCSHFAARARSPPHTEATPPTHEPTPLHVRPPRRTCPRSPHAAHHVQRTQTRAATTPHVQRTRAAIYARATSATHSSKVRIPWSASGPARIVPSRMALPKPPGSGTCRIRGFRPMAVA